MALYLVRHGETDWNREKRFQSRTDVPLNSTGISQAHAIREELDQRGVEFVCARSSPLGRARETARILLEGTGLTAEIEPAFIEIEFGGFEGELEADLRERYGDRFTAWRESEYTATGPAGGENIISGSLRVKPALDELVASTPAGDILIVAHQAVNMAMKVALSGKSDITSAATYRQGNDQVDVWDAARGSRIEQFSI